MSLTGDLETIEAAQREDIIFPPSDLLSNEPPLETDLHLQQMILLLNCLNWWWRDHQDFYATGNSTIYYSPRQRKSEDFRGPDFFVVLGTERKPRKSWVVWEEDGRYPNVIVEILSEKTAANDRGLKKQIYQDIFRTPDYFWFDPYSLEFVGFCLVSGQYQLLEPDSQGWLWSQQLRLYLGTHEQKLRFFTPDGDLVPSPEEAAKAEEQQKELAQAKAEQETKRAEQLAGQLRALGVEPEV